MERSPRDTVGRAGNPGVSGADICFGQLEESVLHVWTFNMEADPEVIAQQEAVLSAEEWMRARRYSSSQVARRFIVRRGLLRRILGKYLDHSPKEIRIEFNAYGKPFLAPGMCSDLQFSLSDSGEMAALAVGFKDPLGIDIERLQTEKGFDCTYPLGSSVLVANRDEETASPTESLPFVKAWTRREAVAKAEGVGLQMLPGRSEIDGLADYMSLTSCADIALFRQGFYVHALTLPAGYVGTLAARLMTPEIVYFGL